MLHDLKIISDMLISFIEHGGDKDPFMLRIVLVFASTIGKFATKIVDFSLKYVIGFVLFIENEKYFVKNIIFYYQAEIYTQYSAVWM